VPYAREARMLLRQYLYFCTSKARKLGTLRARCCGGGCRLRRLQRQSKFRARAPLSLIYEAYQIRYEALKVLIYEALSYQFTRP
jgi:hypothetical protein